MLGNDERLRNLGGGVMPGGLPLGLEVCNGKSVGAVIASGNGTTVSSSVSANTKGSWVQLISSLPADAVYVTVFVSGFDLNNSNFGAVDIGVGASGSEIPIINNLIFMGGRSLASVFTAQVYTFPLSVPAGTRISARTQTNNGNDGLFVNCVFHDGSLTQIEGCAGVDAIGFLSASTTGTVIDPGATASTKGAYTQLVASTSRDYLGFFWNINGAGQTASDYSSGFVDIAIGASGSEQIIMPDCFYCVDGSIGFTSGDGGFIPIQIPAGSRIAARSSNFNNVATSRVIGLTLYGVWQ